MKPVILTRNGCFGGVETIISAHQKAFDCPVIVCGGWRKPAPFEYVYATHNALEGFLQGFDRIIYHWLPSWAVEVVKRSKIPSVEYLHRMDTAENDKSVPEYVLTHSKYIFDWLGDAVYVPYPVDTKRYSQVEGSRDQIGGHSAYTSIKGIDVCIEAASKLKLPLRFYGSGDREGYLRGLGKSCRVDLDMRPFANPLDVLGEFKLFLTAARIEGGPLAIVEALASDVPAVASDIPAHLELNNIAKEMGYPEPITIFKTDDASDMARAIKEALRKEVHPREFALNFTSMERHLAAVKDVISRI